MVRTLSLLAIAGLLLLGCCCTPTAAVSATLWDVSTTGTCSASDSRVVGSLTRLDSGQCVKAGQYGASVRCTADGQVTQAALFSDYDCSIVAFSGSGVGDGMSCIRLSSRVNPGLYFSTIVNCAAPGAEPALSSSAKSGIIAGCVLGGLLLLTGAGWYLYKRRQKLQANTMLHSMAMQQKQQQPATGTPPSHYTPGHGAGNGNSMGVAPGAMMALVCCSIALLSLASLSTVEAAGIKWESRKEELEDAFAHVVAAGVMIVLAVASVLSCCCPGVLVALAAGR